MTQSSPSQETTRPKRPARTPLAEKSVESQVEWMHRQLLSIDNAATVNMYLPQTPAVNDEAACRKQFLSVINQLKKEFPKTTWTTPSGLVWKGVAIPKHMTVIEAPKKDRTIVFGSLLHMAARLCPDNQRLIRWLLASGFDANHYYHDAGSTPVGYMAYGCRVKAVQVLREAGLDMTLFLKANQMSAQHPRDPDMVDSTLLHRFVLRYHRFPNQNAAAQVLQELLLAGLDPLVPASSGRSARDMAEGEASQIIEKWVSHLHAQALDGNTKPVSSPSRSPRL